MEFVEIISDNAAKQVDELTAKLMKTVEAVDLINKKSKGMLTPSGANSAVKELTEQYKQQEEQIKKLQAQIQKLTEKQNNNSSSAKKLEAQSLRESNARNALNKQREKELALIEKEEQKLLAAQNLYNKTNQQLAMIEKAYLDLATRKARYNNLSDNEEKRLITLTNTLQKYRLTTDAVNVTVGKFQQRVGAYGSAFNPLSNSINQIGREMPAFANSVQTGFMAISNNLPIFFDAMQQVIAQNKELQAQGKPTTSVLSQIASSLFSFQTLLTVGVTLLTVYGKEIVNWVSSLWGASDALDELNKNQKEFNKSRVEGRKESVSERTELEKYVKTMRNSSLPITERTIAMEQLLSKYPFYFKNLKEEQMLNGDIRKELALLNSDLVKRSVLDKATSLNVANKQKLIDLKEEQKLLETSIPLLKQKLATIKETAQADPRQFSGLVTQAENEYNKALKRRIQINKEVFKYEESISNNNKVINRYKEDTIRLEYQDKKAKEETTRAVQNLDLALQDYLASEYELLKAQKELLVESDKLQFEDEKNTLEQRLEAYKRYVSGKVELEDMAYKENKRIINKSFEDEKASLMERYNDYIKQEGVTSAQRISAKKELDNALYTLDKKIKADLGLLEVNHSKNILDITRKTFEEQRKLQAKYLNLENAKKFQEEELRDLQQHQLRLLNVNKKTTLERINEIDKLNEEAQKEAKRQRIQSRIDEIQEELKYVKVGSAEQLRLYTELYLKQHELTNLEIADLERKKEAQKQYIELLKTTYKGFIDEFAGNAGFSKLFDIMQGGLKKFEGDAVAISLVVSDAFQQMYNTLSEMSNLNYQVAFENLERQKNIAIQFAGDSTTAKEEIERQYEERRRRLEMQRAQQQKRMAIFNATIDMAQAIIGAWANPGFPMAIPLTALIAGLGAAQIAAISSQQIPAYEKGTENHKGGLMLVNDAKGSNYKETVITPDGKVFKPQGRNVLMNAPKGTKVKTAEWTDNLNNILLSNGINGVSQSNTTINPIVNVETKDNYHFEVNESGFKTFIKRGQAKTEILNGRFRQQKRNY